LRNTLAAVCPGGRISAHAVSQWLGRKNGAWVGNRRFIVQSYKNSKASKRFILANVGEDKIEAIAEELPL